MNVAKTMQALSVGGKYTVTKATFVEKYENGELPDEVEKLINEQASRRVVSWRVVSWRGVARNALCGNGNASAHRPPRAAVVIAY